ncbi:G2/mitotic-specific cyclin-B3 [Periophthalmus magnuspinnatus]|uniref:G2/mitotic-specific cyclin-B3 n=1 Tax=Periophthalmus magnuspinnatus TaxID=409849 RepID=UPI002436DE1D|nr:G2/mitotic-specific cyclin-B3 [Periophthalmus magnuspinnatus]
MPFTRGKKPTVSAASRLPKLSSRANENQEEGSQVKRSSSPPTGAPKKRTAFIDITNAHKVGLSLPGRKKEATKKTVKKPAVASSSVSARNQANLIKSSSVSSEDSSVEIDKTVEVKREAHKVKQEAQGVKQEAQGVKQEVQGVKQEVQGVKQEVQGVKQEVQGVKQEVQGVKQEVQGVQEDAAVPVKKLETDATPPTVQKVPAHLKKQQIPAEFDIDAENREDCVMCPEYAKDIFDYLKQREEKFVLQDYMPQQSSLNAEMRAILVDWLVEVQENFELYHETLYLAVKMTDHYLSKTSVHREMLQLVGSTAMLIASKFEERSPPCVDDFLYICDDAFKREELITMEGSILQTLGFDINIPISYRFLRRYAKCVNTGMDTLTLARYFCEMSLLEMDLVLERGSLLASACLLLALLTKDLGGWTPCLQFHSGYDLCDLSPVVRKLYFCLSAPLDERLKAIRNKYSHKVFFEVAKLPLVDLDVLENALLKKEKTEEPI